jgi:hypothetical protein
MTPNKTKLELRNPWIIALAVIGVIAKDNPGVFLF